MVGLPWLIKDHPMDTNGLTNLKPPLVLIRIPYGFRYSRIHQLMDCWPPLVGASPNRCSTRKSSDLVASVACSASIAAAAAQLMGWTGVRLAQDDVLWKPPGVAPAAPGGGTRGAQGGTLMRTWHGGW